MEPGVHPAYGHLVRNHIDPGPCVVIDPPRRASVTTDLYDGSTAELVLDVVARVKGYVCVRQERPGADAWLAWIPSSSATPL